MTKPVYYRDIWIFGPPNNGYPGGFPNGFINRMKRKWWGQKRLWLCSGGFKDEGGTTVDIRPDVEPDIVADVAKLELPDDSFDFVMLDPPYSEEESIRLYGVPYLKLGTALNEAWRVTRPGSHMLLLHRLIPVSDPNLKMRQQHIVAIIGVGIVAAWSNIRALTVWRKPEKLR